MRTTLDPVFRMDTATPHHCPTCSAEVAPIDPSSWVVYTCHWCATRFARHPHLSGFLPEAHPVHNAVPSEPVITAGHEYSAALPAVGATPAVDEMVAVALHLNLREVGRA